MSSQEIASMPMTLNQLVEQWRTEAASYPTTQEGEHAAAAVRCCANELEATLASSSSREGERRDLRAWVQHKPECALWVRSTPNGEIRFNEPRLVWTVSGYENTTRRCTCGLDAALTSSPSPAVGGEPTADAIFAVVVSVTNRHKHHFASEGIRGQIEEELVAALTSASLVPQQKS